MCLLIAVLGNALVRDGEPEMGRSSPLEALSKLPDGVKVVSVGGDYAELKERAEGGEELLKQVSVLFACSGSGEVLTEILANLPGIKWIQGLFAGLDHLRCEELVVAEKQGRLTLTNAKGVFSSSLAEYVMQSCGYFCKDIPRLQANKAKKSWDRYTMGELRGSSMGIVGYGSIGESTAKLAKAYGIKVIGVRRRPEMSKSDPHLDSIVGMDKLNDVMAESDFLVVCAALTPQTEGMIGAAQFASSKKGQVFINVGRGKLVDEDALLKALGPDGPLLGAACDVFATEPLPDSSPFWDLPNILVSAHNADITPYFQHQSVEHFCKNCALYLQGGIESLENKVSAVEGY